MRMTISTRQTSSFLCAVFAALFLAAGSSAFQLSHNQHGVYRRERIRRNPDGCVRTLLSIHSRRSSSPPSSPLASPHSSVIDDRRNTQASGNAAFPVQVKQLLRNAEAFESATKSKERNQEHALGSKSGLSNLYELQTIQDYKKIVEDSDNKLTVVQFAAPFCLACKASLPVVRKMAMDMPDVNFVVLTVTKQNRYDVRDLGVPSLPYGYVHHPKLGLVEALSTNKRHLPDFAEVVESYRQRACVLPEEADSESGTYVSPFVRAT